MSDIQESPWSATILGARALTRQKALLRTTLTSCLNERGASLLHINCGDGAFLPLLLRAGFDLTACETDFALCNLAKAKLAKTKVDLDIRTASADHLPYEDDSFDWVVLYLNALNTQQLEDYLVEANRVALYGMILMFWNSLSLSGLFWRYRTNLAPPLQSCYQVWTCLNKICTGDFFCRSIFFGLPLNLRQNLQQAGKSKNIFQKIPNYSLRLPFGAWCNIKCTFDPAVVSTGLPLLSN